MKIKLLISLLIGICPLSAKEPNKPILHITHWLADRNGITLGFPTIPNYKYTILGSTNLNNWYVVTNFTAVGYSYSLFVSSDPINVNKQQYFKACYELP